MSRFLARTTVCGLLTVVAGLVAAPAAFAQAACPPSPVRVVRSAGGVIDYLGIEPGISELCKMSRDGGIGFYYFGVWRSDWPGAGSAYPALRATLLGPAGTTRRFVTRSAPGLQWDDSFVNEGVFPLAIDGKTYQTLRYYHERNGIEGNTYHSIIRSWRDVVTGITLKTVEDQIAGQSYGPNTTWMAVAVHPVP